MEREHTKVIRRLAIASFNVRNSDIEDPSDIDLHADNDWARAQAVYRELNKIEDERMEPPLLIYETAEGRRISIATLADAEGHRIPAGAKFIGGSYFGQTDKIVYIEEIIKECGL